MNHHLATLKEEMLYIFFRNYGVKEAIAFWENDIKGKFTPKEEFSILKELVFHLTVFAEDKAKELLDLLPDDEETRALWDYYKALEFCRMYNFCPFPLTIPYSKWWDGPHLPCATKPDRWVGAYVTGVDEDIVYLMIGEKQDGEEPVYGSIELNRSHFAKAGIHFGLIKEGMFLELHFYGEEMEIVLNPDKVFDPPIDMEPYGKYRAISLLDCDCYQDLIISDPTGV
jgi:hypothetical protein